MRHNKVISIALLLLSMTGGALAAGEAAPVEELEAVCIAPETVASSAQVSEPLALACPSYCSADRVRCVQSCNGDVACRQACNDAYIDCCMY